MTIPTKVRDERIMYVCTVCAGENPEGCGHYDRTALAVMPNGDWLCEGCFDDLPRFDRPQKSEDERFGFSEMDHPPEYVTELLNRRSPSIQSGAVDGWQDISTAPKDGTRIVLWLGAPWSRAEQARWYAPWGNWQAGHLPSDPERDERVGIGSSLPTHWRPLPTPPSGDQS